MTDKYNFEAVEKSRAETRNIVRATQALHECTEILEDEFLELQNLDEFIRQKKVSERSGACLDNQDVWQMVYENAKYQEYLVKNLPKLYTVLMPRRIQNYLSALNDFEQAVYRLDSDYPIRYRYSKNSI